MTYNSDPMIHAFDGNFLERDGKIKFHVPGIDYEIDVDDYEYADTKSRLEESSKIGRKVNVFFSILGMIALLWLILLKQKSFMMTIPVWLAIFFVGITINGLIMHNALKPLFNRYGLEWAKANNLPEPSLLSGVLQMLKSQAGKIVISALLWTYLGLRELYNWFQ